MHPNRGNLTVGLKTETVGFVGLIFQRPQIFFSQLRQFSSDFDVSYHFGIRRPNKYDWGWIQDTQVYSDQNIKLVKQYVFIFR